MIAILVAASAAVASGGGGGGAPWDSPGWAAFRAAWDLGGTAPGPGEVDAAIARVDAVEEGLAGVVPPRLAEALVEGLRARLDHRRKAVAPPRGKPPRPDWPARLRGEMEELARDHASLRELRALGWKDPWLEERFARDVARSALVVHDAAGVVEREAPRQKALVREARALVARARRDLPPPPPTRP